MNPLSRPTSITVIVLLLLVGCDSEPPDTAGRGWGGQPTRVVTAAVELQPVVDEIEALGTANANESIEIRPRISSIVETIAFEEGEIVEAGDLLVGLERSEIVAGLAIAEANLSESRSLYDRSRSLASTQAISASNLEQLLAQVKVNEAEVMAAKARLDNTYIRAPFTGRVGLRRISPGSFVDTSTIITTLDDIGTIKLDFSVPETFITSLSEGMPIKAKSVVFPDRVFDGTVQSIDTRLDPVSRSVRARAVIPNAVGDLKPGMFLTVDLQRDRGEVLVAPEQAIVPEGSQQFVFIVREGVVEKRPVRLGRRIPGFVVISAGLDPGEIVVTEGTSKVRAGSQVESLNQASAITPVERPANEG